MESGGAAQDAVNEVSYYDYEKGNGRIGDWLNKGVVCIVYAEEIVEK